MSIADIGAPRKKSLQEMQGALLGTVPGYEPVQALTDLTRLVKDATNQQRSIGQQAIQAQAQQQGQPPIAQQLMAQAQQQGVGSLPTPQYAGGGIVSFAGGGMFNSDPYEGMTHERSSTQESEDNLDPARSVWDGKKWVVVGGKDSKSKPKEDTSIPASLVRLNTSESSALPTTPPQGLASLYPSDVRYSSSSRTSSGGSTGGGGAGGGSKFTRPEKINAVEAKTLDAQTPQDMQAMQEQLADRRNKQYADMMQPYSDFLKKQMEFADKPVDRLAAYVEAAGKAGPAKRGDNFFARAASGTLEGIRAQEKLQRDVATAANQAGMLMAQARIAHDEGQFEKAAALMSASREQNQKALDAKNNFAQAQESVKSVNNSATGNYEKTVAEDKAKYAEIASRERIAAQNLAAQREMLQLRQQDPTKMAAVFNTALSRVDKELANTHKLESQLMGVPGPAGAAAKQKYEAARLQRLMNDPILTAEGFTPALIKAEHDKLTGTSGQTPGAPSFVYDPSSGSVKPR